MFQEYADVDVQLWEHVIVCREVKLSVHRHIYEYKAEDRWTHHIRLYKLKKLSTKDWNLVNIDATSLLFLSVYNQGYLVY